MRGLKRMKKHITRAEAEQKYGVSSTKLYKLVRQGLLRRHDAEAMGFETNRAGPRIRWVYAEEDIVALAKRSPSRALVHRNPEKIVFDLFEQGNNVVEVVRCTKLGVKEVQELRSVYVKEKNLLVMTGDHVSKLEKMGFPVQSPEAFVAAIERLVAQMRGEPGKKRPVRFTTEGSSSE